MFGRNRKTMVNAKAPELASYHKGPILTNGALEFIYNKPVAWPLFGWTGGGVLTFFQFNPFQGPQLEYDLSLTKAPIYGAGVPTSPLDFQNLVAGAPGGVTGEQ
jgi:hypothetical protein